MRSIFLFFIGLVAIVNVTHAQSAFFKRFTLGAFNYPTSIKEISNNQIVVAGVATSSVQRAVLLKVDVNGNVLFIREYSRGFSGNYPYMWTKFDDIETTNDGSILAMGRFENDSGTASDLLLKINQNGSVIWSKTFTILNGLRTRIVKTNDNHFTICYYNEPEIRLVKIDEHGTIINQKKLVRINGSVSSMDKMRPTTNNGLITFYRANYIPYILRLDSLSNPMFSIGFPGNNSFHDVRQTNDGGFISVLSTTGANSDSTFTIIKIDSIGNPIWTKKISDTTRLFYPQTIIENSDQSIFVIANWLSTSSSVFNRKLIILKLDQDGNLMGVKDSIENQTYWDLIKTSNNQYCSLLSQGSANNNQTALLMDNSSFGIQFGTCINYGVSQPNYYDIIPTTINDTFTTSTLSHVSQNIFLFDTTSILFEQVYCNLVDVEKINNSFDFKVYPNPTKNNFTLIFPHQVTNATIEMYNIHSTKILTKQIHETAQPKIDFENIVNGLYFIKVIYEGNHYYKKIIIYN